MINQAAATTFVLSLTDANPDHGCEQRPGDYTKQNLEYSRIEAVSITPDKPGQTPQGPARSTAPEPSLRRAVAFQIQERLRALQQGEYAIVLRQNMMKIRKEIQRTYQAFLENTREMKKVYRMELVVRPLLTSPWTAEPHQSVIRRNLRTELEVIKDVNSGMVTFNAKGGLLDIIEWELQDIAKSAETGNVYSVEMLLHPYETGILVLQIRPMPQVALGEQKGLKERAQHNLLERSTETPMIDVGTQTLSRPVEIFEARKAPAALVLPIPTTTNPSSTPIDDLDDSKRFANRPSKPKAAMENPRNKTVSLAVETHSTREQNSKEDTEATPISKEESRKVPARETVTRFMALKKERQASSGPDAFLKLLNLVRNK